MSIQHAGSPADEGKQLNLLNSNINKPYLPATYPNQRGTSLFDILPSQPDMQIAGSKKSHLRIEHEIFALLP